MKGLSIITFIATAAMSSSALAAPAKTTAASTGTSSATIAPAAVGTSSPSATAASSGTGAISAPVPKAAEKNWSVDLYTENYYDVTAAEQGNGKIDTLAFVGFNRKFANGTKAYIRQMFTGAISNQANINTQYRVDDTELGYGLGKIAAWNNGGLSLTSRNYLPTGKLATAMGRIAVVRADMRASQEIGKKFEVGHLLSPRLSIQSQDRWKNPETNVVAETTIGKLVQYGYVTAKASDALSATMALGSIDTITKRSGKRGSNTYLDMSASAQLTKALSLSVGVDNEPDQGSKQAKRHAFFRSEETQYYMNLFASM